MHFAPIEGASTSSHSTASREIILGTDFSGMDATAFYLRILGVAFIHLFASEKNDDARAFLESNHSIRFIYDDVSRRPKLWNEVLDIYVSGPPCQSFSRLGKQRGVQDARGQLFEESIAFIEQGQPLSFVIENVPQISSVQNGKFFQAIVEPVNLCWVFGTPYHIIS